MKSRFGLVFIFVLIGVILSHLTRVALALLSYDKVDFSAVELVKVFTIGTAYDIIALSYFVILFVLYLLFLPQKYFATKINKWIISAVFYGALFGLVFNGFSEWFFWEEFSVKFNFIAVDYLVYTTEVIGNIKESYPLTQLIFVILVLTSVLFYVIYKYTRFNQCLESISTLKERAKIGIILLIIPVVSFFIVPSSIQSSSNEYNHELSKNGLFSLFSAFRNNQLKYGQFFATLDNDEALAHLRSMQANNHSKFIDNNLSNVTKHIISNGSEIKPNVILIMVESLSAEFLGTFGNEKNLTPNLDTLAKEGLLFDNMFATGTRTVRGMEAVTLSIPPTPGNSIVRRPNNDGLFSAGAIFKQKGYDTKFIYGGYGYFDNMNAFFGANNFQVIDRSDFSKEEATFGNAWGLCDGDLLEKGLKEADISYQKKQPFFTYFMTTSNHRPFTYPDGKIDIPSKTGRDGAVKYTDYAIGEFIKKAKTKPWFKNTVIIVIADHCASSAGKTQLPLEKYRIPMIIYAPSFIKPKIISKLSSQIDTIPTLLSLLHWSYNSKFYGDDILSPDYTSHVMLGTYQKLGFYSNGKLIVLAPQKKIEGFEVIENSKFDFHYKPVVLDENETKDAISTYQSASYLFDNGLLKF